MHKFFFVIRPTAACLCCCAVGLILGVLSATEADPSVVALMRLSAMNRVSIVFLLSWSVVPFLIAAYAVKIQNLTILYILLVIRSFVFGVKLQLCIAAFSSVAWLVFPMLQFSQWMTLIALNVLSVRWLGGGTNHAKLDLLFCVIFITFVAVIDLHTISPFLAELMNS